MAVERAGGGRWEKRLDARLKPSSAFMSDIEFGAVTLVLDIVVGVVSAVQRCSAAGRTRNLLPAKQRVAGPHSFLHPGRIFAPLRNAQMDMTSLLQSMASNRPMKYRHGCLKESGRT